MPPGYMLRGTLDLPADYRLTRTLDLTKNRKLSAPIVTLAALSILGTTAISVATRVTLDSTWNPVVTVAVTLVACFAYMAAHEATHGAVLRLSTGIRPTFALRFPFLTTGCSAFLTRRAAVVVALAPSVLWGIVLAVALFVVPPDYRLSAFVLLTLNFAGSSGDFVEAYVVARQQHDAVVHDDGDVLSVYVPAHHH